MGDAQLTIFHISKYARIFISTNENRHEVLNSFNGTVPFVWQLKEWFEKYFEQEMDMLEEAGMTREMFQKLYDKSKEFGSEAFVRYPKDNPSFQRIAGLFYKDRIKAISKIIDDLQQIYDDCDSYKRDEKYIIEKDMNGYKREEDFLRILNPFNLLQRAVQEGQMLITEIEENNEDVDMNMFDFSDKFKILFTFPDDIQNKEFNNDEIQELKNDWSLLMVKGFALWQVRSKLNDSELAKLKRTNQAIHYCENKGSTDESFQEFSDMKNLIDNVYSLYKGSGEIDFDKLNQIYQDHSNDNAGQVLKPLVEDLIPYYKSLMTPEGLFKIMFEYSEKYQLLLIDKTYEMFMKKIIPNNYYYFPLYFDFSPFKLIDSPGNSYEEIFVISMKHIFHSIFSNLDMNLYYTRKLEFPKELEKVEELDTLRKQKYYVVWYLIDFAAKVRFSEVDSQDNSLLLSLLDWKFEADCEEARTFENYIKTLINNKLSKYDYSEKRHHGFEHFAKFIIQTLNKAQDPLEPNDLKKKLDDCSNSASNGDSAEGGCCTIQ